MSEEEPVNEDKKAVSGFWLTVMIMVGILALLYGPLILALIEGLLFRTHYVEDFVRDIGLHDFYSKLYQPIFDLIN